MERAAALSIADLTALGIRLRPSEAVAIVRALAQQVAQGELPGVPSAHVVRLSTAGLVTVEGPVAAGGRPVARAAHLLADLLPPARPGSADAAPIRQLVDRAKADDPEGTSGLAALTAFAAALAPFAARDSAAVVRDLTARSTAMAAALGAESTGMDGAEDEASPSLEQPAAESFSPDLSTVRRARRETGLSLEDVSSKSRIPLPLLRQLEWGYLRNWPTGLYARTQLVRYARAAGLSQQLVIDAVWPMIEEELRDRQAQAATSQPVSAPAIQIIESSFSDHDALFDAEEGGPLETPVEPRPSQPVQAAALAAEPGVVRPDTTRRSSMVAAAALLALIATGAWWGTRSSDPITSSDPRAVRRVQPRDPAVVSRRAEALPPQQASRPALREARAALAETRALEVRARPIEATPEDETFGYMPASASAGGVVFSDPAAPASPESEPRGGLGLRIARVVDPNSTNYNTRPSPDGSRIAFDSDRDGGRAVFVADADGRHLRRVSGEGLAASPNWSPDGRVLSFARAERDDPEVWNLWILDLDSGEPRRITSNAAGQPLGASWFPDGRRIVYSRGNALAVQDLDSGRPTLYPSPKSGRIVRTPSVSPDGRWVMFQVSGDGAWLLDTTDGTPHKVLSDPSVEDYTWSPDGSRVAYYSRRDAGWNVWVMASRENR